MMACPQRKTFDKHDDCILITTPQTLSWFFHLCSKLNLTASKVESFHWHPKMSREVWGEFKARTNEADYHGND